MKWLRFSTAEFLIITALFATFFALIATLRHRAEYSRIDDVSVSPDGRWIAVIYASGHVSLWHHEEGRLTGHPCALRIANPWWYMNGTLLPSLQWLDNGNFFALSSEGRVPSYVLWDTERNRQLDKFTNLDPNAPMLISHDGSFVVDLDLSTRPKINMHTTTQPPITTSIPIDTRQFAQRQLYELQATLTDDQQLLLSDSEPGGGNADDEAENVRVYDLKTGLESLSRSISPAYRFVAIDRGGKHGIVMNSDAQLAPFDLRENRLGAWNDESYPDAYYDYNSSTISIASDRQTVLVVRYATATILQIVDDGATPYRLSEVIAVNVPPGHHHAASIDRDSFVLTRDQTAELWTRHKNTFTTLTLREPSLPGMGFVFYFGLVGGGILWGSMLRRRRLTPQSVDVERLMQLPRYEQPKGQRRISGWLPIGALKHQELRELKRVVSSPVRDGTWGGSTMFFVGDPADRSFEARWVVERQRHREKWVELTGREYPEDKHSLLIGFQHITDYWLFAQHQLWMPAYYTADIRMLLCEELAALYLQRPVYLLRSLLAMHTYYYARKQLLPPSMQAMVSVRFQADEWHDHTLAWAVRRLRSRQAAGELLGFATFFGTTQTESVEAAMSIDTRRGFHWWCRYVDLATAWSEFLLGNNASAETRARVWQLTFQFPRDENLVNALPRALERTREELQQSWHTWLAEYPVPSTEPAPEIAQIAVEKVLPQLSDASIPAHQRGIAIRALGAAGVKAATPVLKDIFERAASGEAWLRPSIPDVIWSLETLDGVKYHAELTPAETIEATQREVLSSSSLGPVLPYRLVNRLRQENYARRARLLMLIGGLLGLAVTIHFCFLAASAQYRSTTVMSLENYLFPPRLIAIAVHTIAIGLAVGKATRGLLLVAILQMLSFVSCDCFTPFLGLAAITQMRHGLPTPNRD